MLAVPKPVPPHQFKKMFELHGYRVVEEGEDNWVMAKDDKDVPLVIPKAGEYVAVDVLMELCGEAKIKPGDYFELRDQAAKELGIQPN